MQTFFKKMLFHIFSRIHTSSWLVWWKGVDVFPKVFKLEHERNHCVRNEFSTHRPTNGLPCHAPPGADKDCVLRIVYKGTIVATHPFVFFLEAHQVCVKTAMHWKRLHQVKADLTVISLQPGGKLRDQKKTIKNNNTSSFSFPGASMFPYLDWLLTRVHKHSIARDYKSMK